MTFYTHWRDVPKAAWRWPNFSPAEIACRGTGKLLVNEAALDKLQALRQRLGKPLIVRSAYRSPEHNRAVGGAKASKHMEGIAFDIAMANHDPEAFEAAARAVGFQGFGFYPRSGFMHIDLGPARSWGERFPKRATAFAAETPPAREVLAESRTLKGGGAAGVATVGAAGVEVAQQVLAETQGAVLPLVPYLDTAAVAVHRGAPRRHRGRDLRAARRLEAGRLLARLRLGRVAGVGLRLELLDLAVFLFAHRRDDAAAGPPVFRADGLARISNSAKSHFARFTQSIWRTWSSNLNRSLSGPCRRIAEYRELEPRRVPPYLKPVLGIAHQARQSSNLCLQSSNA